MNILNTKIDKNYIQLLFTILMDKEKEIIKLKHGFEGDPYSFTEIGEILDISKQSAFQYYKQGIKRIRKLIA